MIRYLQFTIYSRASSKSIPFFAIFRFFRILFFANLHIKILTNRAVISSKPSRTRLIPRRHCKKENGY